MTEAQRQATIEMRDSKYLKEEDGDDGKDDAEAEGGDMFKKRTHKQAKFAHGKGFGGPQAKSFARKRQRVK